MLRSSVVMALAALVLAAALAPAQAGGYFGGSWYGNWGFYGGRFVVPIHTVLHEYAAYNPNCAFLRRLAPTPLGPQWQLVPVCF